MKKIIVYESRKDDRHFTKEEIKTLYSLKDDNFDYYCDYIDPKKEIYDKYNLVRVIEDMKDNKVSTVIVKSLSDISRNRDMIYEFLKFAKVIGCSVTDMSKTIYTDNYLDIENEIRRRYIEEKGSNLKSELKNDDLVI